MDIEAGLEILGFLRDEAGHGVLSPIGGASELAPGALFGEFPSVGAFGFEIEAGSGGNVFAPGPNAHAHRLAQKLAELFDVAIVLSPPQICILVCRFGRNIGEAKNRMPVVRHVVIHGLGIIEGILAPNVPGSVVGGGRVGRNNINLKIVEPHFAGAAKCRREGNDAGLPGNIGDKFNLLPPSRAVERPVKHPVKSKDVPARVRDKHIHACPIADIAGFHPAGNADALSKE